MVTPPGNVGYSREHQGKALRCRDFSIFDFRVDPEGEVYMLECQPVCSFARESAMMGMASKTDDPALQYPTLYHTMLRRAVARKPKPYDGTQVLGMKSAAKVSASA